MKTEFSKKLLLNKKTISHLNFNEMTRVRGNGVALEKHKNPETENITTCKDTSGNLIIPTEFTP
ncbi:MAG: hypothetical protein GY757_10585 [bacterium]|nr:hypothetical protein [bacterium]